MYKMRLLVNSIFQILSNLLNIKEKKTKKQDRIKIINGEEFLLLSEKYDIHFIVNL